ncbi:FecR family protein [Marinilabilia sp.]|jgi:ferric-dicitrate binding protein FerR (iron transport regulator)
MEKYEKHWEELVKYFRGEASEQEEERISLWRKKTDLNEKAFREFSRIWEAIKESESNGNFSAGSGWRRFSKFYDQQKKQERSQKRQKIFLQISKYAAAVIIGVLLSVGGYNIINKSATSVIQPLAVDVPNSQRSTITLFDGTEVVLNSGSHIEYLADYEKERHVKLSGEAFFSVKKDPDRPFVVETKDFSVRVLGTVFNVKSYGSESSTSTLLLEGSVEMKLPGKKPFKLSPNEKAHVSEDGKVMIEKISNADKHVAWRAGKYYFENEPLNSISKMLERAFDVTVIFENENIRNEKYTGSLDVDEHVRDVMQRLKITSSFAMEYRIDKRTVYISRK